ncbi:MAG: GntR family transcriptional regulator [Acidimicrobiales bacterium]|nr:GntR family transcriptional regulator [Acidimicrobiales bacterium]
MSAHVGTDGKLASRVADRIVDDVITQQWPVGDVLGSEAELLERYGVSRAVFREAVRLVEHLQVARMRRGPGGGLVVSEPSVEAIIDATLLYLHRVDARLSEVFEARLALEEHVVGLVPGRMRESDIAKLRDLVAAEEAGVVTDPRTMHVLLARMTKNPALELFVDILNMTARLYLPDTTSLPAEAGAESRRAHSKIAEAVISGDVSLARRRMRRHLEAEGEFLRRRRSTRQVLGPLATLNGSSGKRGEEVAREIFQGVVSGRLKPGDMVGSEAQLMERFGVSRAIVREAVRLLEHHHLAAMRRGPGGGLFVSEPSAEAVTDVVALYLERHGITAAHVFEVRSGVELATVDNVIEHMDHVGEGRLRAALVAEIEAPDEEFTSAAHDLHAVIASLSGNRVLELLALVLIRLSHLHEVGTLSKRGRARVGDEVTHTHTKIADALISGDRDLSRHRMQRHLDVLAGFFH